MTENIRKLVIEELESKAIVRENIWENLVSSKSLCFNLFGEIVFDLELATSLFKNVFPIITPPIYKEVFPEIKEVTSVSFDYSPYKNGIYANGNIGFFDVFIEYTSTKNKRGFIATDVKYAETLFEDADKASETLKTNEHIYLNLATEELFLQDNLDDFKKPPLFQLWSKHLLSLSILKSNLYEEGFYLFLFPHGNEECYEAANEYRDLQKFPLKLNEHRTGFYWRFLDEFIVNLDKLVNQPWTSELKERYLGTADRSFS